MKIEQILEIIKEAKKSVTHPDVSRLVDAFEEFLLLYTNKDQEDTDSFKEVLNASYERMWKAFDRAAALYGLSGQAVQKYVSNSENFTPEEWESMESMKQEISSLKASPVAIESKKRKKKKGLRI